MELKGIHVSGILAGLIIVALSLFFIGTNFFFLLIGFGIIFVVYTFIFTLMTESKVESEKEDMFIEL